MDLQISEEVVHCNILRSMFQGDILYKYTTFGTLRWAPLESMKSESLRPYPCSKKININMLFVELVGQNKIIRLSARKGVYHPMALLPFGYGEFTGKYGNIYGVDTLHFPIEIAREKKQKECGGPDSNRRIPAETDLESVAFDLARRPPLSYRESIIFTEWIC